MLVGSQRNSALCECVFFEYEWWILRRFVVFLRDLLVSSPTLLDISFGAVVFFLHHVSVYR